MTTISLGALPALDDTSTPQLLIREARRRQRRRVGASVVLAALLITGATVALRGPTVQVPFAPNLVSPRSPSLLTSSLALVARSTCELDRQVSLPNPYSVIVAGDTVHAFFPYSTTNGKVLAGPYNCQFIRGPGSTPTLYGFSTQPGSPVKGFGPHLTSTRVMILASANEGVQLNNAATKRSWVVGVVSPSVRKITAQLVNAGENVNGSFASTSYLPLSVRIKMNGGYFALFVPTSTPHLAQSEELIFDAYGNGGTFLGTSECLVGGTQVAGSASYSVCEFQKHKFSFL